MTYDELDEAISAAMFDPTRPIADRLQDAEHLYARLDKIACALWSDQRKQQRDERAHERHLEQLRSE
jgi:hypothetical protein